MLYLTVIKENNNPDIILNSIPRVGNTFLAFAFKNAIVNNYQPGGFNEFCNHYNVYNHAHSPILLKMDSRSDLIQFTNIRHPDELIPSLVHFNTHIDLAASKTSDEIEIRRYQTELTIEDYAMWLQYSLKYNSTNIIKFDDIKNNIHNVLKYMLSHVGLKYENPIDENDIKNSIEQMNRARYVTEDSYIKNHHLPRGIENSDNYIMFKEMFLQSPNRDDLLELYYETEKRALLDPLPFN